MWYWASTTLASVGYGDYVPKNNTERLITAFIFLIGVAAFSFIMGNFIDMLMEFRKVTAENEDHAGLTKFFGLLARFNRGHPLPEHMARRIEQYFDYYWAMDLNYAMKTEEGERFISELPKEIRIGVSKLHEFIMQSDPLHCRYTRTSCFTTFSTSSRTTSRYQRKSMRSSNST